MEILMSVWEFFQNNILTKPQFFIGFIVFAGYALLRKPIYECLAGFIKAVVGYMILNVASGGLVGNFRPVLAGLKDRFDLSAAVIDPYFGQTAAQIIFFGAIISILGPDLMHNIDKGFKDTQNFGFYILEKSLNFAVYLTILQLGVRMFVSELTNSFQGISDKILPGSVPAVDCAATYGFGHPNAVTFGFLFGAFGQFLAILGLVVFHSPILVISGFVPLFFDNATLAVFANRLGGIRAAAIIPFCCGILQVLGGGFAAYYFTTGNFGGWHGNIDWDTVWSVIGLIMQNFQYVGVAFVVIALLAIPQIIYQRHKDTYFLIAEDYDKYKEVLAKKQGVPIEEVVVD